MHMKASVISIFLFTALLPAIAQDTSGSLRKMEGKVINVRTRSAVPAIILYEKLPYGSIVGVTKTDQVSGSYAFSLLDQGEYLITVKSEGYKTKYDTISGNPEAGELLVTKDYLLIPVGVGSTLRLENLNFDQGKAEIKEEAYEELNQIVAMLNEYPNMVIQLEGHTDFRGSARLNLELSERRAAAVGDYLINQGINKRRIKIQAFGGTQPISRDNTDEAKSLNMRVEVRIIEN